MIKQIMKRTKSIQVLTAVCVVSMLFVQTPMVLYAEEIRDSELYAKAAVLMDAESGRVLYGKNATTPMAMASTTKIMTLLITLENADLQKVTTVSAYAASMPNVQLHIREGEQYYLKDLVYSLMLESHNDSAVAIAEEVGGSVEGFAKLMNEKAKEIGCTDTCFITPNGLDASAQFEQEDGSVVTKEHMTTATDLAKIMSYCVTKSEYKDVFLAITQTQSHSFTDVSDKRQFSCNNHNAFLSMMSGAISGKTGFTGKAGYCYVGALERDGKTYVVSLLACGWPNNKSYKWSDTRKLMEYGIEAYEKQYFSQVDIPDEALEQLVVTNAKTEYLGQDKRVSVKIEKEVSEEESVLLKEGEEITVNVERVQQLEAPVEEGTIVGRVVYMVGQQEWKSALLVTKESAQRIDFDWCIRQVVKCWSIEK